LNTMSIVRTARLAIGPRTNMPLGGRISLMGGCAPPNPAPLAAAGVRGNSGSTPQRGKQTKTKTLRNLQNFSYKVSHLQGHASSNGRYLADESPFFWLDDTAWWLDNLHTLINKGCSVNYSGHNKPILMGSHFMKMQWIWVLSRKTQIDQGANAAIERAKAYWSVFTCNVLIPLYVNSLSTAKSVSITLFR
jgi:hypothetical protein